jgi:FixJ family two-component response regulator
MPIFSGLECMEQLRFGGSSVPVILITAFGDWQVHEQARVHGVRAVLDKPLDMVQLRTAVAEILR